MCCGPLWEKDEDGIMTTYSYNTARQLVEVSRSEVTDGETIVTPETIVSYTRDAFGRILQTRRDVGPMTTTESRAYDLLGQLVQETDVLGRSNTHAYSADGLTETVTTPTARRSSLSAMRTEPYWNRAARGRGISSTVRNTPRKAWSVPRCFPGRRENRRWWNKPSRTAGATWCASPGRTPTAALFMTGALLI